MDKNQGYEITKAVMLENGRGFALGHHPTAPSPYVTWACYDDGKGQRQYEWGHWRCANNLNQVAVHANTYGIYPSEIAALQKDYAL